MGAADIYNFMDGINGITAGYSLSVLVLLRGRMEEIFYEEGAESVWDGDSHCMDLCRRRVLRKTSRVLLEADGDVQGLSIPVGQWHTVNVLEPTVILECKDGRYEPLATEDMVE